MSAAAGTRNRETSANDPGVSEASLSALQRMRPSKKRPLFVADWKDAVFLHYEMPPEALRPFVPFALDLWEGRAFVSLVAFTLDRMRFFPASPGWRVLAQWLLWPVSPCAFLNLRAYVKVNGEPGIYFLSEWLSRMSSVPLGPATFGLPYHAARIKYRH